MSTAFGTLTIVKALVEAEKFIRKGELTWNPGNVHQQELMSRFAAIRNALPLVPTLEGWARETAEELNQILAEHSFDIRLNPWPDDGNTFGVVAINDFTVLWRVVGQTVEDWGSRRLITINGKPAFRLKYDAGVEFLESDHLDEPVVKIPTETGDVVYITKYSRSPDGFRLLESIEQLRGNLTPARRAHYEGVNIPMVKLGLHINIDWLVDLWTQAGVDTWRIAQALQEVKFAMNQFGARVKETTAVAVMRGMPNYYEVDGPFLIWIERAGVPVPLFMAHVTEDNWMDPGELSNL